MRAATIAAEDASFFDNPGFDPRAVLRATYQWIRTGAPQSGASTITQQLVKNTLLGPEQTAERKIKEAFLAMELTRRYSKDQILEMYLNEISFGNRAYGIEAAAQTYFAKPAHDLTLPEAAFLAGLPQAPSYYDPHTNMAAAKERQLYVLEQMQRTGAITAAQHDAAVRAELKLQPATTFGTREAPHFVTYVRQQIEDRFGTEALFRDGLQVTTSLDLDVQHAAEDAARRHIADIRARNATNAAVVAMRPRTGEVLAMVGSVDFDDASIDGQVNVALAQRQPGSTLKPFTYLTAFGKGWNPATLVWDVPTTFPGGYRPNNFDNRFPGPMTVRDALAQSRNIPAIQALQFVTLPEMLATAHKLGIEDLRDPQRYGLSVTLGGGEVKLMDLTYAYSVLANGGRQAGVNVRSNPREAGFRQFDPISVLKVTDSSGKVLYELKPADGVEVADPRLVYQVTSILADNQARVPTYGRNSALVLGNRPAAVKTGTTDEFRDSWTVGYTPELVTGVWVGNTNNTPMRDVLGAAGAGQIWHTFMEAALAETPPTAFAVPAGMTQAEVCRLSGLLATPECRENELPIHGTLTDFFVPGLNLPNKQDDWHQRVEVCRVNGTRATPLVPANARASKVFVTLPEPRRAWAAANGYPAPPAADCSEIYKGERLAQVTAPSASDRLTVGQTIQIVGSVWIDDFARYTLEVGSGDNPSTWTPITAAREQAVDRALLGVWNTTGLQPGRYRLRLRVSDSFENSQESAPFMVTLTAPATPTPAATATTLPVASPTRPATTATPARTAIPPTARPTQQPTPPPKPQPQPPAPQPTPKPKGLVASLNRNQSAPELLRTTSRLHSLRKTTPCRPIPTHVPPATM